MELVVAGPEHVDAILELRDAAATWLLGKGVRQWQPGELPAPWSRGGSRPARRSWPLTVGVASAPR